ncbi:MAG: hypothetical protein GY765_09960, partial [bacterium]|nr:hypothetical protein [bacterium]
MASRFHRFFFSILFSSLLALLFLSLGIPALADDLTNPEGTTVANSWDGTNTDDTMTNYGTVGDQINAMNGNDTIINHGTVGDGLCGQDGNDTITNYGTAGSILGWIGNDTITNHGTVNESIHGQDGDDTITHYGTVQNDVTGGADTDSLTLGAGSSVGNNINTFEFITIKGDTTVGNLNLAGLDTMAVTMSSNAPTVTAGTVTNAEGTLNVEITGGSFKDGQTVNVFSTGSIAGFGTETVTDSSSILS